MPIQSPLYLVLKNDDRGEVLIGVATSEMEFMEVVARHAMEVAAREHAEYEHATEEVWMQFWVPFVKNMMGRCAMVAVVKC